MPKFENTEDFKSFVENASPEELAAVKAEIAKALIKKILLGAAIGAAVYLTVSAIGAAIERKMEAEALTDGTDTDV